MVIRLIPALAAAGMIGAGVSAGTAWAEPVDATDDSSNHSYVAVGTGTFVDALVGYRGTGNTAAEASEDVLADCETDGGAECTVDAVTNDNLCIVSIADDDSDVVAGGAGATVEEAWADAIRRAQDDGKPLGPAAGVVISDCPDGPSQ